MSSAKTSEYAKAAVMTGTNASRGSTGVAQPGAKVAGLKPRSLMTSGVATPGQGSKPRPPSVRSGPSDHSNRTSSAACWMLL